MVRVLNHMRALMSMKAQGPCMCDTALCARTV